MRPTSARRIALAAIVGAVIISAVNEAITENRAPRMRVFVGGAVAATGLAVLAGWLPQLAAALAVVVIVSTVSTTGYDLITPIGRLIE